MEITCAPVESSLEYMDTESGRKMISAIYYMEERDWVLVALSDWDIAFESVQAPVRRWGRIYKCPLQRPITYNCFLPFYRKAHSAYLLNFPQKLPLLHSRPADRPYY